MKKIREYSELKKLLGPQVRSRKQVNDLFEADCEIVHVGPRNFITTSTDSIGEEITIGLYREVETWAWLTVMSSVSDLAASGSSPLGLTLSTQWAFGTDVELQKKFFSVVKKACSKARVPLLGGDSGYAKDHVMTSSILGHSVSQPLMRTGAREGDYLVLAHGGGGGVGVGPALAYRFLIGASEDLLPENIFRPAPSWELSSRVRPYASAAIDTSDGIATCLYTLAQLNGLGFELQWSERVNHPQALRFCSSAQFSPIMLWLGDHGDFQTLFVVPEKNLSRLPKTGLTVLGRFVKKKTYNLKYGLHNVAMPVDEITQCPRDVDSYSKLVKDLLRYLSRFD